MLHKLIPRLYQMLLQWWSGMQDFFNPYYQLDVPELVGGSDLDGTVELYVGSLETIISAPRVTMGRSNCSRSVEFFLGPSQTVEDSFRGATFWWTHGLKKERSFTLKMAKSDRRLLSEYLEHIANWAEDFNRRNRDRILYINVGDGRYECAWGRTCAFKHPSTFSTLALDPDTKATILTDLDRFSQAREFYARVGRPWKRGYLLCGAPGTGKSSLIAAIANYMKYDVYDLELTKVQDTAELRALLLRTAKKSIIVVEDIDRALDLADGHNVNPAPEDDGGRVLLSGFLNFTDGLWSCCGGEGRIVICTTKRKEMLDAELLRSGRLDMHILLSHCSFPAFKTLAFNYLRLTDHHLFPAVEQRMAKPGAEMTPADVAQILMEHAGDPLKALEALISVLDAKLNDAQADKQMQRQEEYIPIRAAGEA